MKRKFFGILLLTILLAALLAMTSCDFSFGNNSSQGEHVHEFLYYEVTQKPSCSSFGTEVAYCECGAESASIIPMIPHTYDEWLVTIAPKCNELGKKSRECIYCGNITHESIPATGHTVVTLPHREATCTEAGLTEGSYCPACNTTFLEQTEIPKLDHIYESNEVLPTCTTKGYVVYTCKCSDSYKDNYVDALGHNEVIDAAIPSTCTSTGLTEGSHCSECGHVISAQYATPTVGHTPGEWSVDLEPTCTAEGLKYRECSVCHLTVDTRIIPELGHTAATAPGKAATCTEDGLTEGKYCSRCNEVILSQTTIPAKGHSYDTVITAPTCTVEGYSTHTCECGDEYVDGYTAPTGHNEVTDKASDPTCTDVGLTEGSHCSLCGIALIAQETIPANGHSFNESYTAPTCTKEGYTTYTCADCGYSYRDEFVSTIPHDYAATVIAPTCTEEGYTNYVCSCCNDSYKTGYVNAIGHSFSEWTTLDGFTVRNCENGRGCEEYQRISSVKATYVGPLLLTGEYVLESHIQLTATLSDGTTIDITDFTLENDLITKEGTNIVTVKFGSYSINVSVSAILDNLPKTTSVFEFTYTVKNGEITITKFNGNSTNVVIPAHIDRVPVRAIQSEAFMNNSVIQSVTIPGSIRTINPRAFYCCYGLTTVTLNEGLETIGGRAFSECPIRSIVIPDSVTEIATIKSGTSYYGAFENCTALRTVVIGDGVSIIHRDTFHGCSSLETVTFGESLTSIYPSAFEDCDSLVSISLENNIISIGGYAFADCDRLTDLVIGDSVTTIGDHAFESCNSLKNITLGSGLTTIDTGAFNSCTAIESIDIPANVQHIGIGAFYGCSALTSLTLNEGLSTISGQAFYGCPITSIVIPDSVTEIATIKSGTSYYGAFENCTALRTVVIGDGVSIIHRDTFHGCSSLETVTFGESLTSIYPYAFEDCDSLANICLTNKISSVGEYAFYDCDGLSNLVIGDSVTTIGDHAFESCNSLKNITIGSGLTTIGIESFRDCIGLESLVIPGNVSTIREGAFYGCTNLTYLYLEEGIKTIYGGAFYETSISSVVIPDSVTTFDIYKSGTAYYGAFEGCKNLKTVTIGSGLTVITTDTFKDCISLESIYIPGNIQDIGDKAFYGCTGLSSLTLCEGIKTIGGAAFYGSSVTSLVLPDSLVKLDTYPDIDIYHGAFEDCKLLKTLVIGDGLTVITRDTFRDCDSLEYVTFGKSVVTIENGAFYDCDSLVDLVIGDSVVTIDDYAFKNCDKLKNITFGKSVTTIDDEAFMYCISIESLYIPGNVQHIGNGAFFGCTGLSSLTFCEGIKTIEGAAFYGSSITSVVLPDSLIEINSDFSALPDDGIFEKCMLLKTVVIGDGLTVIANDTFRGCTALTSVEFGSNVQKIGQHAFAECSSLSAISLPSSMITIDDNAFMDCTRLSSIDLGCGTQRINEEAFSGCTALRAIVIPASVQIIENEAFAGCVLLHEIIIEKGLLHTIGNYVFDECRTARIYYTGTESDWANISIGEKNDYPLNDTPFFYSAHKPASVGNFWFYNDNGETVVWNITKAAHKADIYYNELLEKYGSAFDSLPYMAYRDISTDPVFIATFAAWTTLEIVINPFEQITASISQQQFYEIAIYDILMITHGSDQSLLAMSELDKKTLFEEIRNEFYDGALDNVLKTVNITEDFADFLIKKFDINNANVPSGEIISTINFLLDISENAFEATERICNYMVLRNTKEVFLDILVEISNDTSNKKDLREAAINCVKYISASFDEAMNMVYDKMEEDSIHSAHVFIIDEAWNMLLDAAGLGGISIAAKGISFLMDMSFNMDKAVATFYQLTAAVRFESALRKIVTPQVDYLRQENLHLAPNYNEAIRFYECAMIKGHDYTVEFYDACQTDEVDTDEIRTAKKKLAIEFDDLDASINYRYELYLGYVDSLC